ncbi:MAG: carbonate dehydratase [Mariprofundaceae bacterium]|nr:carbonate dehydratase [Mariprofundaceae bacterium]
MFQKHEPEYFLQQNAAWSARKQRENAEYFKHLSMQKKPNFMWIGCSDSRVPANEMIGIEPGHVFVHRNVANQVQHIDLNALAAVQYAVDVLQVKHIIVTGHYDCGGVHAAMESQHFGMVDNWIRGVRDLWMQHHESMEGRTDHEKFDRLCELNVMRQVANLSHTRIIQNAWARQQPLSLHGWIYHVEDGLLRDLKVSRSSVADVDGIYRIK